MKKLLTLFVILFITQIAYSQDMYYSVRKTKEKPKAEVNHFDQNNLLHVAGNYLEKSSKMQYGAIGCAVGSGVMAICGSQINDRYDKAGKKETNVGRIACYAGAGVFGVCAVVFEIMAIDCKMKAGKTLKLHPNAIAITF